MEVQELIAPSQYNIAHTVERFADDSTRPAIRWLSEDGQRRTVSYRELVEKSNQYAQILRRSGLNKGDKVLIILPRIPEAYMTYLACLKAGLVAIPCSEMLRKKDLVFRMEHSGARAVVAHHQATTEVNGIQDDYEALDRKFIIGQKVNGWQSLEEMAKEENKNYSGELTSRDDLAFLSYTSGTTGNPKGVAHTHGWGYAHVETAAKNWLNVEEGDLVWATAAPGWQKWIWSPFLSTITLGATAFVYHGRFEPETYLQLLEKEGIEVLCCTPTEYRLMVKVDHFQNYQLPKLKSAVSAGEPLNRPVIDAFQRAFNINVRDGYGQTENTLLVGTLEGMEQKPGSMGVPTPGNQVEIIDQEGAISPIGEVGDIAVHKDTPALFKRYYHDPERTLSAYRGDWYLTGDQAFRDEDGYFWFVGRSDDIIISAGYTIGPFEVEDALVKHETVKECAVVGVPDEIRGNIVKAYVVLREPESVGSTDDLVKELQDHTKRLTAPYKYPRTIEFIDDLPKTTSGKIRRVTLRQEQSTSE
ncbi:acetyl-CoA synthetase [Geomicrobium halophilum]|uniref:Acetyl-CoA synthetase n=1 Tax=Geomicrobium halophilum TaxID=549000 RepID=A0A841PVF4_9BACL|nr:acyl--CoA ligase [Geomicrobium halophilum]MBB6451146.1 acetyl-CoA synthetase [Geomicrobium halophilum]